MHKDLTYSGFESRFFHEMDFMLRVIESCNVRITAWFLVRWQDSELGVIQDLAGIVDLRVCGRQFCGHCDRV